MGTQRGAQRRLTTRVFVVAVAAAFLPIVAAAQGFNRPNSPIDLPNGPAKPGFDISRFNSAGKGWFQPFHVKQTEALRDALKAGKVAEDTRLLVTDIATGKLAFVSDQMAYHHLAQGSAGGKDWLVTF
jgi:hypothetical protein